jgi:stage II sporulation protein D
VNELPVEDYLRGLGEVSNTDNIEKIKVIIVAARSYARYYMDRTHRKYDTNLYDGSDDPDSFQKYLGYGYESRSPNVSQAVKDTLRQVIVYQDKIIKAWYHSSSDGRTLSALEYCQKNGTSNCVDIPYLQSVVDPG